MTPTLIFCSANNKRFVEIAVRHGYRYGAQLPGRVYPEIAPIYFADQDWRKPDRDAYISAVAEHRPVMATVLDWEREEQFAEVLEWAEAVAPHVELVQIIPKVIGGTDRLPRRIGGRPVVLGYSAASSYGGTPVPIWEFAGWPVHILGGMPQRQIRVWRYLKTVAEVVSIDGNVVRKMAKRCLFWVPGTAAASKNRFFPSLGDVGLGGIGRDAIYEAFERSCVNVTREWRRICFEATAR